jgi:hypothetical protein
MPPTTNDFSAEEAGEIPAARLAIRIATIDIRWVLATGLI